MVRIGKDTGGAGGIPQEPSEGPTGATEAGRKFALPKSETKGVGGSTEAPPKTDEGTSAPEPWDDISAFKSKLDEFLKKIQDKASLKPPANALTPDELLELGKLKTQLDALAKKHPNPALQVMFRDISSAMGAAMKDLDATSAFKDIAKTWGLIPDHGPIDAQKPAPQPPDWKDIAAFKKELDDFLNKIKDKFAKNEPLTPAEFKELCRLESHMQNLYNDKAATYPDIGKFLSTADASIRAAMNSPDTQKIFLAIRDAMSSIPDSALQFEASKAAAETKPPI